MKKLNLCKNITILGFLGALLFSCSNNATIGGIPATDDSAAAECRLVIKVDESSARTILALDVAKEDMSYTLSGVISSGTEAEIKQWDSYEAMTSDTGTIIDAGDWTFTLNAMKNETTLYSDTITKKIEAGTNSLEFLLKEVSSALSEGKGDAKVTLKFPGDADISSVEAGLLNPSDYSVVEGFEYEPLKIENGNATYSKDGIKSGIYVLKFKLYRSDGTEINPGFRELIQIKAGRLSAADREIDALEKLHTLTLENIGLEGVTLDGNATLTFNEQQKVKLPNGDKISRTGYAFGGWYDNSDCTGDAVIEISAGTKEDVTLWAKWTANTYTVTFNANSGTGTMEVQTFTYDTAQSLTENTFTKAGYTFAGWATTADGTKAHDDKASVKNLATSGEVTLFAVWTREGDYTITYELNGGTGNTNPISYNVDSAEITLGVPTKTGYTFAGWYEKSDFTGNSVTTISSGSTGNKTFYAKWTPATVNYKVEHLKQNVNDDDYKEVDSDTETKEGKTEATTEAQAKTYPGFTAQAVTQKTIEADGSTVIQIKYDRNRYTFTFNADGGNWDGNTENKTVSGRYEANVTAPAAPTKTGYTFNGWDKTVSTKFTDDDTFTAKWTANKASITVTVPTDSDIGNLTKTETDTTITLIAPENRASYSWRVDGELETATTNTLQIEKASLDAGLHSVMVTVDGEYSATFTIAVER